MISREVLNDAVLAALKTATGKQGGLSDPPTVTPTLPYFILYPMFTTGQAPTFADGDNIGEWVFQVTCVGTDAKQCGWMSSRISRGFLQKGSGGTYTYAISPSGMSVWSRTCDGLGAIVQSGDDLYQCADTYRVKVEETS